MLKRSLLFLTVLLLLFSFSSITNEVSASSSFDKG
ncbi:kinase, partial [Staphylococcus aureus]|nr:kinase [Staphylococcus aureus]